MVNFINLDTNVQTATLLNALELKKSFEPLMYSTIISKDIRECPFQLLILCKFFQNLLQCDPPKLGIRLEDNVEQSSRY